MEKDIEYWREVYLENGKTQGYKQRIEKAKECFKDLLKKDVPYQVNLSGGKDSLVLWHLCRGCDEFIAVNYCDDVLREHTHVYENIEKVSKKFNFDYEIREDPRQLWELIRKIGKTTTDYRPHMEKGEREWLTEDQKNHGVSCIVLGLRADESRGRKFNFKKRGHFYYNKGFDIHVCQPIAHLTGADVFTYLFENEIPIPEIYFWTKFHDNPERIRVDWLVPLAGKYHTQDAWIKEYFPSFWKKLCYINPKFRSHA